MTLKPLSDRVVVTMVEVEETTNGAMQDGKLVPMSVKVGERVIASKYAGTTVKMDGVEYTVLSEDDILAIVE